MASTTRTPGGAATSAERAVDGVGERTLELFRENDGYSEFLWESLAAMAGRPVSGRVLEVGCGIGNVTRLLLRRPDVSELLSIDMDPAYVRRLEREVDDPRFSARVARAEEYCTADGTGETNGFDFIVSSNVLEHIRDDQRVLENFARMLRPQGLVLLLVPAHQRLFCGLDRELSHFRRYDKASLGRLAVRAGLEPVALRYFNPLGAVGWWWNGKVLRRQELPAGQLAIYTRFAIPISRWLDGASFLPFGVSLLAALSRSSQGSPAAANSVVDEASAIR